MQIIPGESGVLGAQVHGIDLSTITPETTREILAGVHHHALIRFKNQKMSVHQYRELGEKLGEIMPYPDERYRHPEHPGVFVSSNVKDRTMGMARSGYFWHTDLSFKPKPQPLTVLYPQLLPQAKRETLFINMADVYDALPAALRSIVDGRTAKHDPALRYKVSHADVEANRDIGDLLEMGRRLYPPPTHPLVITHPVTKRRILYMNSGFTTSINGIPHEESQVALKELFEFIERPEHVQAHSWELGDVIIWDNRMLIHRAGYMASGDYQTIFRLGIDDMVPFYEGIAAA
ncbi:MAG TPA: TauD/TfdA family dioxygenase [Kofleriaceae bacterium]|nr:TauD/TfdA family dioxygenase [Kofleriaceae bacterium]